MPQWRKLHVKARESFDINDMPDDFTRLLWVMLPLGLCREGRGIDNASWIKSQIMPLRNDVTPDAIESAMEWYESRGMIERYTVAGRPYFWVPSFGKYQGNTSKEAASEYPPPPSDAEQEPVQTNSGPTPELVWSKSGTDVDTEADTESDTEAAGGATATADNAFGLYHRYVGVMNGGIAAELRDLVEETEEFRLALPRGTPGADVSGDEWVQESIREMARAGPDRMSVSYISSIIARWRGQGYKFGNERSGDGRNNQRPGGAGTPSGGAPQRGGTAQSGAGGPNPDPGEELFPGLTRRAMRESIARRNAEISDGDAQAASPHL